MEELYRYDPRNRLTEYTKGGKATTFTYDRAGNLLSDDKARYTYDAFNRTEKAETFDGHVQINRYDAEGLRHELEEDGRLVQFIFRGREVVTEEKENNIIRFIRGYDLVASDAERARTYYHYASDEMGSITHITEGTDVLNRYEYDAWGNAAICEETVENRFRFNGQQHDPVTQQYYLRARYYNPIIARFTQADIYWGDGLNLYVYCQNNPVYYVDPSGYRRSRPIKTPNLSARLVLFYSTLKFYKTQNIGSVPSQRDFNEWFDGLTERQLSELLRDRRYANDGRTSQSAFEAICTRLRNGGKMHEWLPVSQAVKAKQWGVTAAQIKEWTTLTSQTYFQNIEVEGVFKSGFHGKDRGTDNASYYAHKKLIEMMQESSSLEEYRIKLNDWADKHLILATNDGKGNIKQRLAMGRQALPEGLRILGLPGPVGPNAGGGEPVDISPRGNCPG